MPVQARFLAMSHPEHTFTVDEANVGRRLDTWLRQTEPGVPLAAIMRWLRVGRVRLDGRPTKGPARLVLGQKVTWPLGQRHGQDEARAGRTDGALRPRGGSREARVLARRLAEHIAHEDTQMLVVNKPALVACHAGTGHDGGLMAWVEAYLGDTTRQTGHRPGLIQRLDRGVSGLVPIGKTAAALRAFGEMGAEGNLKKTYLALVWGAAPASGTCRAPLVVGDEPMGNRPRTYVAPDGKPAVTHWRRLSFARGTSLVALRLETGRTHQIRAHLFYLNHCLLGDPRYGVVDHNQFLRESVGIKRPLLHGFTLAWQSQATTPANVAKAQLPDDFLRALKHFGHLSIQTVSSLLNDDDEKKVACILDSTFCP